jgi:hypothetical protein
VTPLVAPDPRAAPDDAGLRLRAVVVLDDEVCLLRHDGALEPLLAGGWPRPGHAHATARARRA